MSYSISAESQYLDELETKLRLQISEWPRPFSQESREQAGEAITAAVALLKTGYVGKPPFVLTVTGHANPDHQPIPGWSNDSVSVNLYSKSSPKAE